MSNSLEYWIEQFGIEKCTAAGITIPLKHFDADDRANSEARIVFRAEAGPLQSEGVEGKPVELSVEFRGTLRDAAELDEIFQKIETAFDSTASVASVAQFSYLDRGAWEEADERDDNRDTRHRARVYQFLARLV